MKTLVIICLAGMLLSVSSAFAVTIDAQVEGPLLSKERVVEIVGQNLSGEIADVEDLEQGGKYRLYARVASKHIGPGSWFLYLAEIELQRQVTDESRTVKIGIHADLEICRCAAGNQAQIAVEMRVVTDH